MHITLSYSEMFLLMSILYHKCINSFFTELFLHSEKGVLSDPLYHKYRENNNDRMHIT